MSSGDCFILIDQIRGEAEDPDFAGNIQVSGWRWGMSSEVQGGAAGLPGRRADVQLLEFLHTVDSASPGLMARLVSNAILSKAVLSMRRAGGKAQVYLTITLKKVRVASVELLHDESNLVPVERVRLAFQEVQVDYVPQDISGRDATGRKTFAYQLDGR